jgi:hypothetical protein
LEVMDDERGWQLLTLSPSSPIVVFAGPPHAVVVEPVHPGMIWSTWSLL